MMLRVLSILLLLFLTVFDSYGTDVVNQEGTEQSINNSGSLDDELRTPVIDKKQRTFVRTYMKNIAEGLYRQGLEIETMRSGEVVIAVIPTDDLFYPNDSTLMKSANKILDQFTTFFSPDRRYKVILAVHSDNTGSESYLYDLTRSRVDALFDYFEEKHLDVSSSVGFAMGDHDPLTDNSNRANRSANRRAEIYIVPDEGLIKLAKESR